jgi:hypothetical protein
MHHWWFEEQQWPQRRNQHAQVNQSNWSDNHCHPSLHGNPSEMNLTSHSTRKSL